MKMGRTDGGADFTLGYALTVPKALSNLILLFARASAALEITTQSRCLKRGLSVRVAQDGGARDGHRSAAPRVRNALGKPQDHLRLTHQGMHVR